MATLFAKIAGGNWNAANTWSNVSSAGTDNSGPPTAADDCVLDIASGNVTINAGSVCRSVDCAGATSYDATLTHSAGVTWTIGDGTAGTGNRALRFSGAMTYTKGSTTTSATKFVSTSATQQTVEITNDDEFGDLTFDGVGGSWIFAGSVTHTNTAATWTLLNGSLDTNGQQVNVAAFISNGSGTRSLTFGGQPITLSGSAPWDFGDGTGLTFFAGSSTITLSNPFATGGIEGTLNLGGKTYNNFTVSALGSSGLAVTGANTFNGNLQFSGSAGMGKVAFLSFSADQTIAGSFLVSGGSLLNGERLLVRSDVLGQPRTISAGSIHASTQTIDMEDIIGAGTASWDLSVIVGLSGDCGGNSGITFTTPATQTRDAGSAGTWNSSSAWTSRVPLPQDDVIINSAFGASLTLTADMPRLGKSIDWTGTTGEVTFALSVAVALTDFTLYGSLTLAAGMAGFTFNGKTLIFKGRSAYTFTAVTASLAVSGANSNVQINMIGGSLTHSDNYDDSVTTQAWTLLRGEHILNGFTVNAGIYSVSGTETRALTIGSGTLVLQGTGTVFDATDTTNLTVIAATGTISITDTSATAKTFIGGGLTYPVLQYTTGGTGAIILTGANTFTRIAKSGSTTKTITFPGGVTTSFTGTTPLPSGTSGNLQTFQSSSGQCTCQFTEVCNCNFISLSNNIAAGQVPAYAGTNSTNGGGNVNWNFNSQIFQPVRIIKQQGVPTSNLF